MYYKTLNCEALELNYCRENYLIGIDLDEFYQIDEELNFELVYKEIKNKNNFTLRSFDILKECPNSGYMYCGIYFEFENNLLKEIFAENPCH